jgi:hypothetical protein
MLGQMMKVSDENFALSIKQDPVIVVLDVISVKPKSLKAVRKRDLKLIQELEEYHYRVCNDGVQTMWILE